ncbi:unnamed protein product [Moneuplotes crassus]|uniref:Acid phosphatase n=1 Tax=Euplotes crassus TaxID=5936 RepID=A0AAD1UMU8_EUPCR|nr:unnamed protein product [Moneuplotes crassus]
MQKQFLLCVFIGIAACELLAVVEVTRHGARTPMEVKLEHYFGVSSGLDNAHLTPTGERQHYLLGAKRRKQYVVTETAEEGNYPLLSPKYDMSEMYIETTDRNRTFMSAYSHMIGMYPPLDPDEESDTYKVFSEDHLPYDIKTSVYHSLARVYDEHNCPYAADILQENLIDAEVDYANNTLFQDMLTEANLNLNLPRPFSGFNDLWTIVDTYEALSFSKIGNYTEMSDGFIAGVEDVSYTGLFPMWNKRLEGVQLSTHPYLTFLDRLLSSLVGSDTPTPSNKDIQHIPLDRKYYFFSGHDTTLSTYLCALNHSNVTRPVYASSLLLELHEDSDLFYIRYLYNGEPLILGSFCNSEGNCELQGFLEFIRTKMFTDGDYDTICSERHQEDGYLGGGNYYPFIFIGIALAMLISFCIGFYLYKSRNKREEVELGLIKS